MPDGAHPTEEELAEHLDELEELHWRHQRGKLDFCDECEDDWPCDTTRLVAAVRGQGEALQRVRECAADFAALPDSNWTGRMVSDTFLAALAGPVEAPDGE